MCLELVTKQLTFGGECSVKLCKYKQNLHLEHENISLRKSVAKEKNRRTEVLPGLPVSFVAGQEIVRVRGSIFK